MGKEAKEAAARLKARQVVLTDKNKNALRPCRVFLTDHDVFLVFLWDACKERDLERIIESYDTWLADATVSNPTSLFAQCLDGFVRCLEDLETGDKEEKSAICEKTLTKADDVFLTALDKIQPSESIYCVMLRICRFDADKERGFRKARQYFDKLKDSKAIKWRLRTFINLFQLAAALGEWRWSEDFFYEQIVPRFLVPKVAQHLKTPEYERTKGDRVNWHCTQTDHDAQLLWEQMYELRLTAMLHPTAKDGVAPPQHFENVFRDIQRIWPSLIQDGRMEKFLLKELGAFAASVGKETGTWENAQAHGGGTTSLKLGMREIEIAHLEHILSLIEQLACEAEIVEQTQKMLQAESDQKKKRAPPSREDVLRDWKEFRHELADMLAQKKAYDCVLDGANIGHAAQNWEHGQFSHAQIDAVIHLLREQGREPLVVLREHWLTTKRLKVFKHAPKRARLAPLKADQLVGENEKSVDHDMVGDDQHVDDSPASSAAGEVQRAEKQWHPLGTKWANEKCLFISPRSLNDDWIFLYVAIKLNIEARKARNKAQESMRNSASASPGRVPSSPSRSPKRSRSRSPRRSSIAAAGEQATPNEIWLVSNDQMRDHFWRLHSATKHRETLEHWRDAHLCKYDLRYPNRYAPEKRDDDPHQDAEMPPVGHDTGRQIALHPPGGHSVCVQKLCGKGKSWWFFPCAVPVMPPLLKSELFEKEKKLKREGKHEEARLLMETGGEPQPAEKGELRWIAFLDSYSTSISS